MIAFDSFTSNGDPGGSSASYTIAHTVSGSDTYLVVAIAVIANFTISSVTYNGDAMSSLGNVQCGTGNRIYIWGLANPDSGTHNVVVTPNSSADCRIRIASYTGVDQTTPVNTSYSVYSANPGSDPWTVTYDVPTTVDDCWFITMVRNLDNSINDGTNFALREASASIGYGDSNGSGGATGASQVTIDLAASTNRTGLFSIALAPAVAAAATTKNLTLLGVG